MVKNNYISGHLTVPLFLWISISRWRKPTVSLTNCLWQNQITLLIAFSGQTWTTRPSRLLRPRPNPWSSRPCPASTPSPALTMWRLVTLMPWWRFCVFVLVLEVLLVVFTFALLNKITINNFLLRIFNRGKCSAISGVGGWFTQLRITSRLWFG